MRTTEQTYFRWAAKGIGGVVNIIEQLLDDGVVPDIESCNELTDSVSRAYLAFTRANSICFDRHGIKTNSAQSLFKAIKEQGGESQGDIQESASGDTEQIGGDTGSQQS
jgi:hypothetical protein